MQPTLKSELRKYYVRRGNRIIFQYGMSLNQLALSMWENLGYQSLDASVLSRAITGKRLLNLDQISVFAKLLNLNEQQHSALKYSALISLAAKHRLNPTPPTHPDLNTFVDSISTEIAEEYFSSLTAPHQDVNSSVMKYWQEHWQQRFLANNYHGMLEEINAFTQFIHTHQLQHTKSGMIWLSLIQGLKAEILTQQLPPSSLLQYPRFVENEYQKIRHLEFKGNPMNFFLQFSWGSLMRSNGEILLKTNPHLALTYLAHSFNLREKALSLTDSHDPFRAHIYTKLMATAGELELYFPQQTQAKIKSPYAFFNAGLNIISQTKSAKIFLPFLYENRARSMLRQIKNSHSLQATTFIDKVDTSLALAEKAINKNRHQLGICKIQVGVTKIKLYKTLGQPIPKVQLQSVLHQLIASQNHRHAYRLMKDL